MIDMRSPSMDNIKNNFLCTLLIQCFIIGFAMSMTVRNLTTDQSTLIKFKNQTLDPHNVLASNWSSTSSVCHWVGVSCNARHGRVCVLDLSEMGLEGAIAPHLGNLSFLVSLNLSGNNFHGHLPKELAKLRRLKLIDLSYNALKGEIPLWLGALHKVKDLVLSNNNFTGTIPPTLANMSNLETLDLGYNFIQGKIPYEIGDLQKLKLLRLRANQLSGSVPSSIFNMSSLQLISLSSNKLSGSLPSDLCYRLPKLENLLIGENEFSGHIPSSIGECIKLQVLALDQNQFRGVIPRSIGNLTRLQILDLSNNSFEGQLPCMNLDSNLEELYLGTNYLSGNIPNCISNASMLKVLMLYQNSFSGIIPDALGNLSLLEDLRLWSNHLTTKAPNHEGSLFSLLANCKSLSVLEISSNPLNGILPTTISNLSASLQVFRAADCKFKGTIPFEIGSLSNMRTLILDENELRGTIPRSIGNLTRLEQLSMEGNSLEGEIPNEIGNLARLEIFYAWDMQLSGQIPPSLFNISSLKEISIKNNSLSGKLPCMSLDSNLEGLYLWGNYLSGTIPDCISNASKLKILSLNFNSFSGLIPNTLGNLSFLEELRLWSNQLTTKAPNHEWTFLSSLANCKNLRDLEISLNPLHGNIPTSISNLSASLQYFFANKCKIKGAIPMEIGSLSNIVILSLVRNELSGSIPATIGGLQNVQGLYLAENNLQGSIPYTVCHLEKLSLLSLRVNMLQGPIPPCLGDLTSLRYLYLDSNKLHGKIPFTFWSLKDILEVYLSSNYLNGSLPLDIGNLKVLTYLDLSRNLLSGDIPVAIGGLNGLQTLSLSSNKLQGAIPQSLGDMISLETLDLSDNYLSGIIPKSLERLSSLRYFNVAYNRLEGEIPTQGCFQNFTAKSFMKNYALCGSPQLQVPPCKNSSHRLSKTSLLLVLRYVLPIIASIIVMLTIIIILKKFHNRSINLSMNEGLTPEIWSKNLYNRLLQATDRFSEGNLLGSGSFGSVYKGTLSNGRNVAIKVFNLQLEGAFRSFDVECEVIKNVLHRNLVKIISWCSCVDFKALVLEFMPNGSLEQWLYSDHYFLNILQRINIMIDVASALEYLHLGHPNPVIHCDLKPSNVLLDRDMVAHVGDFGIAKLLGEAESTKQTMTLATIGYMAPEYGSTGIVSAKSDVYSYGILLMETFTRRKPTDEIFVGEMSMKHWVKESLSNGTIDIADSSLLGNEERQFMAKANSISSIMKLALDCSAELPEERKDMKDVVSILKKIKVKYLKDVRRV